MLKKLFLSLLVLVSFSLAAQAQKKDLSSVLGALDKTLEETNRQAALNHFHRNKPATPPIGELVADTQAADTCAHCGKKITSDHQHCSKTAFVFLCETAEEEQQRIWLEKKEEEAKKNQKIKNMEKYPLCTRCGEPVTHPDQECSATHYEEHCTPAKPLAHCPECGREVPVGTKCSNHHKPIVVLETEVPAENTNSSTSVKYHYVAKTPATSCGPICPDCGRTPEQVKIHGHNHK